MKSNPGLLETISEIQANLSIDAAIAGTSATATEATESTKAATQS
jgi:hypothetical protein